MEETQTGDRMTDLELECEKLKLLIQLNIIYHKLKAMMTPEEWDEIEFLKEAKK